MRRATILTALLLLFLPQRAGAQLVVSSLGFGYLSFSQIVANVVNVLQATMPYIVSAIFVAGAALYIVGGAREDWKSSGKSMMIGAIIGAVVVMLAKAILNTIMYFIYGS